MRLTRDARRLRKRQQDRMQSVGDSKRRLEEWRLAHRCLKK